MLTSILVASFLVPPPLTQKGFFGIKSSAFADDVVCAMPDSRQVIDGRYHVSIPYDDENSESSIFGSDAVYVDDVVLNPILGAAATAESLVKANAIREELMSYALLEDGWDGEGSLGPRVESLNAASEWLKRLPSEVPYPRPMVGSSGNVGLYWDLDGGYAEISFEHEGDVAFFATDRKKFRKFVEGRQNVVIFEDSIFDAINLIASERLLII